MRAFLTAVCASAAIVASSSVRAGTLSVNDIATTLSFIEQQANSTLAQLNGNTSAYPYCCGDSGTWSTTAASAWTSGFWPWELTSLYRATGDPAWLNYAIAWTTPLAGQAVSSIDADTGMRMLSYGALYSITGDPAYKSVLVQAANTLAGRFNPIVGGINQWDTGPGTFTLLADGMNDLEPLAWVGANVSGDSAFLTEAKYNADLVASTLARNDGTGSWYQLANFDPATGALLSLGTENGYSATSDWQRGLAWEMNGYLELYQQIKDPVYLEIGEQISDHFVSVLPSDCVSVWDASAPSPVHDTSAAALGALALTELGALATTQNQRNTYAADAQCVLKGLISGFLATSGNSVLTQGNAPGITSGGLIYGDAAFTAALTAQLDLLQGQNIAWTVSYGHDPPSADASIPEPGSVALVLTGIVWLWPRLERGRNSA